MLQGEEGGIIYPMATGWRSKGEDGSNNMSRCISSYHWQQPQRGLDDKLGWQLVLPKKMKALKSHTAAVVVALTHCDHLGLASKRTLGSRVSSGKDDEKEAGEQSPQTPEKPHAGYIGASGFGAKNFYWAAFGFISDFIIWCFWLFLVTNGCVQ